MVDQRAPGGGSDFLQIDPSSAPTRGRAGWLAALVRAAVTRGQLEVGALLPTSRALAADLGWSRGVVVDAYERLREEGLTTGNARAGTRISFAPVLPPPAARHASGPARRTGPVIDLSPGVPDLTRFPRAAWLRAERAALDGPPDLLRYGDPAGDGELRRQLVSWLARHRGISTVVEDLVVVSGVAQALALTAHAMVRRGAVRVAVEDPGSRGARDELAFWGLTPVPVPVDEEGMRTDLLPELDVDLVLVTPAHQYPTGVTLSARRRVQLVQWAQEYGGFVVEDDYDAEHRYDRTPTASLHAQAPQRVLHTGSVSKTLAPALRLGWMVVPTELREAVLRTRHASDLAGPGLPQAALATLLADGSYERHLRLSRRHQRGRRDVLVHALHGELPEARVSGIAAGLHVLLGLPRADVDDVELAGELRLRGVLVEPLGKHRIRPGGPGLVLGYAAHTPERLETAARVIAEVVRGS